MKCENCNNTGLEREDKVCPICNGFGGDVESVPAEVEEIIKVDIKPKVVKSTVKSKVKSMIKTKKK